METNHLNNFFKANYIFKMNFTYTARISLRLYFEKHGAISMINNGILKPATMLNPRIFTRWFGNL